ncbi:MAG: hypothetical protein M9894_21535 [Planctomycetes bacterium]|nr:hypothetical protein [Planctomycetota bacterium]
MTARPRRGSPPGRGPTPLLGVAGPAAFEAPHRVVPDAARRPLRRTAREQVEP